MPIQASNVTHNNNGHFYRIAIDIAKEGAEVWDLTPYFKGRVGDDNFGLQIVWYYQGRLLDVTNMTPYIKGNVGHYSFDEQKNLQMAPDADVVTSHGKPSDCQANGQATYYFPQQMFPTDGIFKGFIGLEDENQNLTGVDIWFRVLPGVAKMGHACDVYVDVLDKTIADFKEKIRQQSIDFDAALQLELQKEKDLIQQKLDAASDAMDEDTAALKKLAAAVGAIQAQIDAGNVVTLARHNSDIAKVDKRIDERMAQIDNNPEWFEDLAAVQAAYPTGKTSLIVTDDGYKAVYQDGKWQRGTLYQTTALDKSKIPGNITAYFTDGIIPTWDAHNEMGNLDLSKITGISIKGQSHVDYTKDQLLDIFTNSKIASVANGIVSGTSWALTFDVATNTLAVEDYQGLSITPSHMILFGHHYFNNDGLLVNSITSAISHNLAIYNENTTVAYPSDNGTILLEGPESGAAVLKINAEDVMVRGNRNITIPVNDILDAAKASTLVKVDGENYITGKAFAVLYDYSTSKIVIQDSTDPVSLNQYLLYLKHYDAVTAGGLVDAQIRQNVLDSGDVIAYLSDQGKIEINEDNEITAFRLEAGKQILTKGAYKKTITVDDIYQAAQASSIVAVTEDRWIKGSRFMIVYSRSLNKVVVEDTNAWLTPGDLVLFFTHYASKMYGALYDQFITSERASSSDIPAYWRDNVNDAIQRVNENMGTAGPSGLTFLFITDQHWDNNRKLSPLLVKEVMKRTGIPYMFNGGDLINQGERVKERDYMTDAITSVQYPGVFMPILFGNHDDNWNDYGEQHQHPEWKFNHNSVYGYMYAQMERNKKQVEDFRYLNIDKDFTFTYKVTTAGGQAWRFICYDTGEDGKVNTDSFTKTIDLIKNSENEKIILMAHWLKNYDVYSQLCLDLEKVADARNAGTVANTVMAGDIDFSQSPKSSRIVACFGGHKHLDLNWSSSDGVPFILTDCDNAVRTSTTTYGHDSLTTGEQCFDVVTIDPGNKAIKCVRIGRGVDRQFAINN